MQLVMIWRYWVLLSLTSYEKNTCMSPSNNVLFLSIKVSLNVVYSGISPGSGCHRVLEHCKITTKSFTLCNNKEEKIILIFISTLKKMFYFILHAFYSFPFCSFWDILNCLSVLISVKNNLWLQLRVDSQK